MIVSDKKFDEALLGASLQTLGSQFTELGFNRLKGLLAPQLKKIQNSLLITDPQGPIGPHLNHSTKVVEEATRGLAKKSSSVILGGPVASTLSEMALGVVGPKANPVSGMPHIGKGVPNVMKPPGKKTGLTSMDEAGRYVNQFVMWRH
jgi:hypothetical protein